MYIFSEHCIKRKTDCSVWNGKFSVCVHYIIQSSISTAWRGRHLQGTMRAAVLLRSLRPSLPINGEPLCHQETGARSPPGPAQVLYGEDIGQRGRRIKHPLKKKRKELNQINNRLTSKLNIYNQFNHCIITKQQICSFILQMRL